MELFTIKQTAEFLSRSKDVIRELIKEGGLPAYKIRGNWMLKREEIEEWLVQQKKK